MSGGSTRSGPGAGKAGGGDVMAGGAAGLVDASGAVLGDSALGRGRSSAGVLACCGGAGLWPHSSHGAPGQGQRGWSWVWLVRCSDRWSEKGYS